MALPTKLLADLDTLADDLGLGKIVFDASDRATLTFDEMPVTFSYRSAPVEALSLIIELGEIPTAGDEAPKFLLQTGLLSWATGRMAIGLDDTGRQALGNATLPVSLIDASSLKSALVALLEVALPLRERLAKHDFRVDDAASEASPSHPHPGAFRV